MIPNPHAQAFSMALAKFSEGNSEAEYHAVMAWNDRGEALILDASTGNLVRLVDYASEKDFTIEGVLLNTDE